MKINKTSHKRTKLWNEFKRNIIRNISISEEEETKFYGEPAFK